MIFGSTTSYRCIAQKSWQPWTREVLNSLWRIISFFFTPSRRWERTRLDSGRYCRHGIALVWLQRWLGHWVPKWVKAKVLVILKRNPEVIRLSRWNTSCLALLTSFQLLRIAWDGIMERCGQSCVSWPAVLKLDGQTFACFIHSRRRMEYRYIVAKFGVPKQYLAVFTISNRSCWLRFIIQTFRIAHRSTPVGSKMSWRLSKGFYEGCKSVVVDYEALLQHAFRK